MFNKLFLATVLAVSSISSLAGTLTVDLYRGGNASSPRLDNVRDKDVTKYTGKDGKIWVKGKEGGISTFSVRPSGMSHIWKARKGTTYSSNLYIYESNKVTKHWSIAPARDMTQDEFERHLRTFHSSFTKQP